MVSIPASWVSSSVGSGSRLIRQVLSASLCLRLQIGRDRALDGTSSSLHSGRAHRRLQLAVNGVPDFLSDQARIGPESAFELGKNDSSVEVDFEGSNAWKRDSSIGHAFAVDYPTEEGGWLVLLDMHFWTLRQDFPLGLFKPLYVLGLVVLGAPAMVAARDTT